MEMADIEGKSVQLFCSTVTKHQENPREEAETNPSQENIARKKAKFNVGVWNNGDIHDAALLWTKSQFGQTTAVSVDREIQKITAALFLLQASKVMRDTHHYSRIWMWPSIKAEGSSTSPVLKARPEENIMKKQAGTEWGRDKEKIFKSKL